jgi:hypothetical protein
VLVGVQGELFADLGGPVSSPTRSSRPRAPYVAACWNGSWLPAAQRSGSTPNRPTSGPLR